jgi:hypothetical protein
MKLVYLADREHFIRHGVAITGDRQCAMPYGPVPSHTLDLLNGDAWEDGDYVYQYLHLEDRRVRLRLFPETNELTEMEIQTLDHVIQRNGATETWKLVKQTHRLPEYEEAYVEGTSRPIPYERIAKFSGNPDRFRHNRPVVSQATADRMINPFPPDLDL